MAAVGRAVLEEQGREEKYIFIHFLDSIPSTTSSAEASRLAESISVFDIAEDFDELDVVQQRITLSPAKFH